MAKKKTVKRAEKIGLSEDQVDVLPDAEEFMDAVAPETNEEFSPKLGEVKEIVPKSLEVKTFSFKRSEIEKEKDEMKDMVRHFNRKFDYPKMSTLIKTVIYDVSKKKIIKAEYEVKE